MPTMYELTASLSIVPACSTWSVPRNLWSSSASSVVKNRDSLLGSVPTLGVQRGAEEDREGTRPVLSGRSARASLNRARRSSGKRAQALVVGIAKREVDVWDMMRNVEV